MNVYCVWVTYPSGHGSATELLAIFDSETKAQEYVKKNRRGADPYDPTEFNYRPFYRAVTVQ